MLLQIKTKKYTEQYTKPWDEIKYLIKAINVGDAGKNRKNLMKIKFSSDDNLPLNKVLKLFNLTIVVRSVFEDGKYYPQSFYINDCKNYKRYNMKGLIFQKELILIEQKASKHREICHY